MDTTYYACLRHPPQVTKLTPQDIAWAKRTTDRPDYNIAATNGDQLGAVLECLFDGMSIRETMLETGSSEWYISSVRKQNELLFHKTGGRRRKDISAHDVAEVHDRAAAGQSKMRIGRALGISEYYVKMILDGDYR